jgi:beta-glucosidase
VVAAVQAQDLTVARYKIDQINSSGMGKMKIYMDTARPIEERMEDLLGQMTIDEKIGQLKSNDAKIPIYYKEGNDVYLTDEAKEMLSGNSIGLLTCATMASFWLRDEVGSALEPVMCARLLNKIQKFTIENTRLGIPVFAGSASAHGHASVGTCMFPVNLMMASTWNPGLVKEVSRAIAREARLLGSWVSDSTILDLTVDPRWGRTEENYGEDPYLAGIMVVAAVNGLQNDNQFGREAVAAHPKHFTGHSASIGGHNRAASTILSRELHEKYLWPFREAIRAGALMLMPAYNDIDGIPNHINKELLTDTVKGRWGYRGMVIADCDAIVRLHDNHKVAESYEDAQTMAFNAGVDLDLTSGSEPFSELRKAFDKGRITMDRINDAVARILYLKFKLGMFDGEIYIDPERTESIVNCPEHRQLAREAVRQGVVLLENKNGALPLKKEGLSIAVVGPNADNMYNQMGDYTPFQSYEKVSTVYKGIRDKVLPFGTKVQYAKGCSIKECPEEMLAEALAAAKASDVVIAVMGGSSWKEKSNWQQGDTECGEGVDRSDLNLYPAQQTFLEQLKKTGKKLIVVLINGRPMSINWLAEHADAVLEAWYPASEGGNGIADIIFGDCCPSGKLTVSVPRSVGQLPVYYNRKFESMQDYIDLTWKPLYPFGYGLSYTKFTYANLAVDKSEIRLGEEAAVSVDVTNAGDCDGDEVVQLYIRDDYASVTRPFMELKDFRKVGIKKGRTERVAFRLHTDKLKIMDINMQEVTEPGTFTLMAGGNSQDVLCTKLTVLA